MAKGKQQQRGNSGKAVSARPAATKISGGDRQSGGLSARFAVVQEKKKPQKPIGGQRQRPQGGNRSSNMAGSKESQQRLAKSKKQGSEKQNKSSKQATVKTGKQSSGAFKAAANSNDLDMELDQYWFKAGKGPDPQKASLDRDIDEYFNQRKSSASATGETAVTEEAQK